MAPSFNFASSFRCAVVMRLVCPELPNDEQTGQATLPDLLGLKVLAEFIHHGEIVEALRFTMGHPGDRLRRIWFRAFGCHPCQEALKIGSHGTNPPSVAAQ